jgi:putative NADH-flavin reductase
MKLLILGATGGTGRQLVEQALARGHEVTVLARSPDKLGPLAARVRVVQGALPQDAAALSEAMRGQDAVVSALGVGNATRSGGLMQGAVPVILDAMARQGVQRVLHVSAFGVGSTAADVPALPRLLQKLLLADVFADKLAGEGVLRESGLEWTIVYPSILTDGARTARYRTGEHLALRGLPRISRADVADFVLGELQDARYVRKGAMISA